MEVKGRGSNSTSVTLTYSEQLAAIQNKNWHLALVAQALTQPKLSLHTGSDLHRTILGKSRGIDTASQGR